MKWFQHKTGSHDNPDISDAMDKFGDAGYSVYFILLEIYGQEFDKLKDGNFEVSLNFLRKKLRKNSGKLRNILEFFQSRQKILFEIPKDNSENIIIKIPYYIELADNWSKRPNNKKDKKLCSDSVESTARDIEGDIEGDISTNVLIQCPHQDIIDLYHKILPELSVVKIWGEDSRKKLRARWKEDLERQNIEWWESFFTEKIRTSDFLMGKVNDFQVNLGWMIGPKNFEKIMNGFYKNKGRGTGSKRSDKNLQVCEDFIYEQQRQ